MHLGCMVQWPLVVQEINVLVHQGDYVQHANLEGFLGSSRICEQRASPNVQHQDLVVGRRIDANSNSVQADLICGSSLSYACKLGA